MHEAAQRSEKRWFQARPFFNNKPGRAGKKPVFRMLTPDAQEVEETQGPQ
jgi:hypothetical protein